MKQLEVFYCDFAIQAVLRAWAALMQTTAGESLNKQKKGKRDTKGMDGVPENTIRNYISKVFNDAILVTEETDEITRANWPEDPNPKKQPLMFFSDPMDRSSQFGQFLSNFPTICGESKLSLVGDLIANPETIKYWEKEIDNISPVMISGATISISCVSMGKIIVSAIMNVINGTIFVACESGIYFMKIPMEPNAIKGSLKDITLGMIEKKGKKIIFDASDDVAFRKQKDLLRFVAFVGKTGYDVNLESSGILPDYKKYLHHELPGGPARILFLSEFQPKEKPVGFILANGEKIGEWIHWLAYAKFARDNKGERILCVYEVNLSQLLSKEGILMSPPPPYSVFRRKSGQSVTALNLSRLRDLDFPSHFRSMILVTLNNNRRVVNIMEGGNFYEVSSYF